MIPSKKQLENKTAICEFHPLIEKIDAGLTEQELSHSVCMTFTIREKVTQIAHVEMWERVGEREREIERERGCEDDLRRRENEKL